MELRFYKSGFLTATIRRTTILIIFSYMVLFWGCGDEGRVTVEETDLFTPGEWAVIRRLSSLPEAPPPDPTNRVADHSDAALLGQMFFFDARFSKDGTVSCATCHSPFHGFADVEATSLGAGRGTRNAPTLLNAAYNQWQFWDGRADTLWSQALVALEGPNEQAGSRLQYAHLINQHYREDYEKVFGNLPDLQRFPPAGRPGDTGFDNMSETDQIAVNTIFANIGKSIEAYERLLISRHAPFDRYAAGDLNAISPQAKQGLKLFLGKGNCILCHKGPNFTDNNFHNLGIPQGDLPMDTGRYDGIPKLLADPFNSGGIYSDSREIALRTLGVLELTARHQGQFKTPTLRNVALTAPYGHTGEFPTLEAAIEFDNMGGGVTGFVGSKDGGLQPLNLSEVEKADLIEFLLTLTGEFPLAQLLRKPNLP